MSRPIRLRLSLSHLAVLLVGMGLTGVLVWFSIERLYIDTQRENLLAQARLTATAMQGSTLPLEPAEPYLQTLNAAPGIHTRLLGEQGAVLIGLPLTAGDLPVQAPLAENSGFVPPEELLQRPEIQQALKGQAETAVRRVASAEGRRVLYAAAPVFDESGEIAGIVYLATPLPPSGLPINLIWQLAGAGLIAALLAGLMGMFLARGIARLLESLDRAAAAVSAGNLNQKVPADSHIQELDNLGNSFNQMTASLRKSNQAKNTFIANVTHELRTPLTVIKGTIETLEDGAIDDLEGRGALLGSMQRETDRFIRLVNDLLVLTRSDAGALNLDIDPLDLAELARSRCEYLSSLAASHQIKLEVITRGSDLEHELSVLGDSDRLAQVFDNLLDNAIRYAPSGSTITIELQSFEEKIQCEVKDQGSGIPPEHLPHIFERFYRVEFARDRHTGGSGLGLAIVHSLILAQGGGITATSDEGQGTTITFWLPALKTDTQLPQS
jgi:signal transduction histidine kinase